VRPTLDLDPTDVEVYGRQKEGVAYNHQGQLVGRPHPVVWAEAGVVVAAELGDGRTDPRPQAPGLIRRGVAGPPTAWRRRSGASRFSGVECRVGPSCRRRRRAGSRAGRWRTR
jgi:hypothetical protein